MGCFVIFHLASMMPARRFKISSFALRCLACVHLVSTSNVQADSQQTSVMDVRGWDASIKEVQVLASDGKGGAEGEESAVTLGVTGALSSNESLIEGQGQVRANTSERKMRTAAVSTQMTVGSDGEIAEDVLAEQNQLYHNHKLMRHNRWQSLHDRDDQVTRRVVSSSGDVESFQPEAQFGSANNMMTTAAPDLATAPSPVLAPTIVALPAQPLAPQPQPIPASPTLQPSGVNSAPTIVALPAQPLAPQPQPIVASPTLQPSGVNSAPTIVALPAQPVAPQPQPIPAQPSAPTIVQPLAPQPQPIPASPTSQSSGLEFGMVVIIALMLIVACGLAVYTHILQKSVRALQDEDTTSSRTLGGGFGARRASRRMSNASGSSGKYAFQRSRSLLEAPDDLSMGSTRSKGRSFGDT